MTITDCRLTANERSGRWNQTSLAVPRYACLPSSGITAEGWLPPFRLLRIWLAIKPAFASGGWGRRSRRFLEPRISTSGSFRSRTTAYGAGRPTTSLNRVRGVFYVTEQRRLFLDCAAGRYQDGHGDTAIPGSPHWSARPWMRAWTTTATFRATRSSSLVRLVEAANGRKAGGSASAWTMTRR